MLAADDDLRHDLGSVPMARESMVWNVLLPDQQRYAIGYFTMKPSTESTRLLVVFGPDGEPLIDVAPDQEFEGENLDDFIVAGMRIAQPERSKSMTVTYSGDDVGLDYRFDALHEPFDFERNADGCTPVAATNRFEQAGRISGALTVGGDVLPFATTGHRDHSWGVRDYRAILHWKWISAQAGPSLAMHAMHTWYQGRQFTNGYVARDGLLSPVTELVVRADFDADVMQRAADLTLTDEAGRTTNAAAEFVAGGFLPLGDIAMAEAGCRFQIDGHDGIGVLEYGWQPAYLAHLRGGAAAPRL